MSRKKIRYLILGVIVFYIVTVAFTFFMLKSDDSVLAEQTLSEILFGKENEESSKSANQPVTESFSEMFTVCHPVSTENIIGQAEFKELSIVLPCVLDAR